MKLFPRSAGQSHCPIHYLRCWAHRVLDAAKAGIDVDDDVMLQALKLTGDVVE